MNRLIYLNLIFILLCFTGFSQENNIRADIKFSAAMNNIRSYYVDSINEQKLVETALKSMLKELDPHSVYLTKEEIDRANESLTGNFDGVGITFQIYHDSILVLNILKDGPADKAGVKAGDRILRISSDTVFGQKLNNAWVVERLRGEKGTHAEVEVYRKTSSERFIYDIKRDKIPIFSIESSFMLDPQTGYIKLNRFSGKTMTEFYTAFIDLKFSGMQNLILDLRGNSGGYLQTSIDLADEFIGKGNMIVYTEGKNHPRYTYRATSQGEYEKGRLVLLIDEGSASASEILAGAIQDCDRGLIIGRRSYGKGLVQRPYYLPDGSAIRLTTARYYTPSGRSIQKPYQDGVDAYFKDLSSRFKHGEYISADSIRFPDSLRFQTLKARTVYGGGGIMPDIFIPIDTTTNISWYKNINAANLPYAFAIQYLDNNRMQMQKDYPSFEIFAKYFQTKGDILDSFMVYCRDHNQNADSIDISKVKERIPIIIKAHIASLMFDASYYNRISFPLDETLIQSMGIINDKSYFKRNNIDH